MSEDNAEEKEHKEITNRDDELKRLQQRRSELAGGIEHNEKTSLSAVDDMVDYTDDAIKKRINPLLKILLKI